MSTGRMNQGEHLSRAFFISPQGMRFMEKLRDLRPHVRGQILLFNFERPQNEAVPVKIKSESFDLEKFNPLGIASYANKNGGYFCYRYSMHSANSFAQCNLNQLKFSEHVSAVHDDVIKFSA